MSGGLTLEQISTRANEETPVEITSKQINLTKTWLLPHLDALYADLQQLRTAFDNAYRNSPEVTQNPRRTYPKGYCLEISKGVQNLLQAQINNPTTPAMQALREFCMRGGVAKRIWGNLRNSYFQNAYQFGSLYVDVANDTVNPSKPQVEILPWAKSGFYAIRDYTKYALLAEAYWGGKVYPNRYLPELAVMFPIIFVNRYGEVELQANYQTILYRNMEQNFKLAELYLFNRKSYGEPLPAQYHAFLQNEFGALAEPVADDALRSLFADARKTSLRLDITRCQPMLDQALAIGNRSKQQ
ncbi:hypothetical protein [Thalassospira marina]|uniref:Uncharacterized protein n=1 Tax=Thalassospira marina TaxID=2048283 RepID=A0ABM6QA78_9PROT|nr:hypothetical protein [Thalassospira marina]AUG53412.1 hypothetical protein CSC3H3_12335 [Thalassospira marina]